MSQHEEKGLNEVSNEEELSFIFQAAFAPFSIIKRLFVDHKSLGNALIQTIDRDKYVKDLRLRRSQKRDATPT